MLISIGITVLVLAAAIAGFVATRPAEFRIQRTATIDAPCDVVFAIINNLHRFNEWSPYERLDPNMKKTYEGPAAGPGASYAWSGNNQAGEGRLTIVESIPGELVSMALQFTRPFKCNNEVNFKLSPSGERTRVSWIMDGKNNLVGKVMCMLMNMDRMVGTEFEQGLTNLDRVASAELQRAG